MKIYVYAICKNESAFAARWLKSMSEADGVYVLDTGSTDDTVKILRDGGAIVHEQIISPWRFDSARNLSLSFVPEDADICVSTDLDEVLRPGWRNALEAAWRPGTMQARYPFIWSFNPDGSPGVMFWIDKIHARFDFTWINPVHEIIKYTGSEPLCFVTVNDICAEHHADNSKPRGQYLPLLELAVTENPDNDRNMHYLGREYMYYRRWEDCIATLMHHLSMPAATWDDERAASMRYIAKSYAALGNNQEAERWHIKAAAQAPHQREPWIDYAMFEYSQKNWAAVLSLSQRALKITKRPLSYICEAVSWGDVPHDLAAIACYHLGMKEMAIFYCIAAAEITKDNERLKRNLSIYKQM